MRNWVLLAVGAVFATIFLVVMGNFFHVPDTLMLVLAAALFLLGVGLIVLTVRNDETGKLRFLLILAGACAAAMPVAAVLHNFIFHAFFFILALIVFPFIFMIAWVASVAIVVTAGTPAAGTRNLLIGAVIALILACLAPLIFAPTISECTS